MKLYQFKIFDDEELQNYLDNNSKNNISEFIRKILRDVMDGKLVIPQDENDLDILYKKGKNELQTKRIIDLNIKNKKALIHDLKISPLRALEIASGKSDLQIHEVIQMPKDKLTTLQWDDVYGCVFYHYEEDL